MEKNEIVDKIENLANSFFVTDIEAQLQFLMVSMQIDFVCFYHPC